MTDGCRNAGEGGIREPGGGAPGLAAVEAVTERRLAFEEFYRAERESVLRAVAFTLDDTDLGVEATDEAMARAFERWPEVSVMTNPAGWVYRVAVNVGRNRVRRRLLERRKPVPPDRDRPDLEGVADPAIAAALTRLPLDQRMVVVLRYHLDWPLDEIAEAVGCATGTVKSRLHRALQRLESMLGAPA
jgi:RNA polymerase sigma factor (sigma-70 family)